MHVPNNVFEDVLNPVALGPADVWLQRNTTIGKAPATTAGLLHWNGRRWSRVTLPAGTTFVDSMTEDGHGGLWLAAVGPKPNYPSYIYHLNGKWTRHSVPAVKGTNVGGVTELSWIPGTRSVWATADMLQRGINGEVIGAILKHAG